MEKNHEWNLLLAEEMEYDDRLDELTDDQVFAFMDELECGGLISTWGIEYENQDE